MGRNLAKYISILLGPHFVVPLLFFIVVFNSGLTDNQLSIVFPSVLILQVIIPVSYLLLAPKMGWVEKWDMEKKEERMPFFRLVLSLTLISLYIVYKFGNPLLFGLNAILIIQLLIFACVTIFWKISLHVGLITGATLIISFLFDWSLPQLYLAVPIVAWSRYSLKKHTPSQLVAGAVVASFITIFGLSFL